MSSTEPTRRRGRDRADAVVRAALATGDLAHAVSTTIATYGAEVYGFLRAVTKRGQDARVVYGCVIEQLPRELRCFRGESELRVLVYSVACRESRRHRALSEQCSMRTASAVSSRRRAMRTITERLAPEDLELLVLRVDRGFSWRQLANTSLGAGGTDSAVRAEALRLRARFDAMRRELSHLAKERSS